jgi:hypothetical protein
MWQGSCGGPTGTRPQGTPWGHAGDTKGLSLSLRGRLRCLLTGPQNTGVPAARSPPAMASSPARLMRRSITGGLFSLHAILSPRNRSLCTWRRSAQHASPTVAGAGSAPATQRRFHARLGLRGPSIQNWNADRGSQAPGLGGGRPRSDEGYSERHPTSAGCTLQPLRVRAGSISRGRPS